MGMVTTGMGWAVEVVVTGSTSANEVACVCLSERARGREERRREENKKESLSLG